MKADGSKLSEIESPAAASHQPHLDPTATAEQTESKPTCWERLTSSPHSTLVYRLLWSLAVLCAVGLVGGFALGVGLWDTQPLTGTLPCNMTEETSLSDHRKGIFNQSGSVFYRISAENSLLEIQLGKTPPTWLPVCYERWNSSLGTLVCRQLGHLRLTKHKGVNITDIWPNYAHGFMQITHEHKSNLETMWQFRGSCSTGKVIALQCLECGTRATFSKIVGGGEATLGSWPWQVSLYYNNDYFCGGSVITRQWILTAAHCVHNTRVPDLSSWTVYAGIVERTSTNMAQQNGHAVEKIIHHEDYNSRDTDSDIALMKLRTPLDFSDTIRPICLPQYNYDPPSGTQCWISGWGHTVPLEGKGPTKLSEALKEAAVPIISTKKCNSSCMYDGMITPRMLCAGYTDGKMDACQGDSGSPLVCQDDDVWRLIGVVSWGNGCAQPNYPGVYTKVAEFLGWIYDIIEN